VRAPGTDRDDAPRCVDTQNVRINELGACIRPQPRRMAKSFRFAL